MRRSEVIHMLRSVLIQPRETTLVACAVAELCDDCRDVHSLCVALAHVEHWTPQRARYWLAQCWADELIANGTTELTLAGWIEFRHLRGELCGEDLEIWREAA